MKTLTREKIQRMGRKGGTTVIGGGGSSGSGGGGGSVDYAAEAGHAEEADHATEATTAQNLAQNSTDWNKIADKTLAQTIAEAWTFAKGIISTLKSYFNGGIEVTGGTKTDTLNATGNATIGGNAEVTGTSKVGAHVVENDSLVMGNQSIWGTLGVDGDADFDGNINANGNVTAAQMIAQVFKTLGFTQAVNMIGKGFGVTSDANGNATLQTDHLLVLGRMIVQTLNIREVTNIGGSYQLTAAASEAIKVMPLYTSISYQPDTRYWTPEGSGTVVGYRLLWLADNGSVGTMNYWKQGDIALCQTFNVTQAGAYTTAANQYYKRVVVRVGQVKMTEGGITKKYHYADVSNMAGPLLFDSEDNPIYTVDGSQTFDGLMVGSTTPKDGDKVVQCGSESDASRQGCIYITAEGEASIGIYDGIKDFRALSNYEIHYMSKSAVRMNAAYFSWRSNGNLRSQADVLTDIDETMTEVADINVNLKGINMTVGKMQIIKQNGITANFDFWEQSGDHTIRNSSWESGYWLQNGTPSASSYRIRSSQTIYSFGQADGFLVYDMAGGQSMQFFEFNNNGTGQPPTYALRYTPPTQFAVPETYTVKAHILSYISDGQGGWTYDQHAEEADANSGVVFITPSKGSAVRFRIYFVATGKMIGSDPVDAITNLQPYLAQAKVSNSLIQMVSDQLKVMVNQCGLNIKNRIIELIANKVNFLMPDGSTNAKISIDPTTGALNAVDGNFSGTVRANNLFIMVSVSSGSGASVNDRAEVVTMIDQNTNVTWVYVLNDIPASTYGHAFTAGQYLTGQEINELVDDASQFCWKDDTTNFRIFTGPATQVMLVNKANADYQGYTFIPRCQDVPGKTIEIRNNTTNHSDAEIRQVDLAQNVFASGAYVADIDDDDYNDVAYGSNLEYHDSVPMGGTLVLYSTGTVWLRLRRTNS